MTNNRDESLKHNENSIDSKYAEENFDNAAFDISKRQIFSRRPKKAADLISKITARYGIGSRKSNDQLQGLFDSIVGVEFANHCRVNGLSRGVLEVLVSNSALTQQLSFKRHEIINHIKKNLPNEKISDLRFRSGPL